MRVDIIDSWTGKRRSAMVSIDEHGQAYEGHWLDDDTILGKGELFMVNEIILK
jgi:hypothetical protein